jgi:transposase
MKFTVTCNECGQIIVDVTGDRKIIVAEEQGFWCPRCEHFCMRTMDRYPVEIRVRA